ncbi:hypothetical protein [Bacillus sp. AFS017274]|uniref:hypothetical protein n=1 Tax=Bacillus sp. AFS017274 TaxID=2033488 RepID=UPI000BF840AD|nr:hypothetical protein [Bacillus sp. AFS017274]PEZ76373.1 hypothetical protein CN380_21510 [Bacillus sp. AFS017274]
MLLDEAKINTILYTYIKRLYGKSYKLTSSYSKSKFVRVLMLLIIKTIVTKGDIDSCRESVLDYLNREIRSKDKDLIIDEYERLFLEWDNYIYLHLFLVALYLVIFKEKITDNIKEMRENIQLDSHPLSLTYDNGSTQIPYQKRIHTILETEKYFNDRLQNNRKFC